MHSCWHLFMGVGVFLIATLIEKKKDKSVATTQGKAGTYTAIKTASTSGWYPRV
jgi:hypothetical protein